jgi:uncharacterized small protein (DUF1192 family)
MTPTSKKQQRETLSALIAEALARQGRGAAARLAEATGVSPGSVSRWASGGESPDMVRWPIVEETLGLEVGTFARALGISESEAELRTTVSDLSARVAMLQTAVEQLEARLTGETNERGAAGQRNRRKN